MIRTHCLPLVVIVPLLASCPSEKGREVQAMASQPPAKVVTQAKPVAPVTPVPHDERGKLDLISKAVHERQQVRVLVRLEDEVHDAVPVVTRSAGGARKPLDTAQLKRDGATFRLRQDRFLEKLGRTSDVKVVRFSAVPCMEMDLRAEDVQKLTAWFEESPDVGPKRPFRVWIEEVRELHAQRSAALSMTTPIDQVLQAMDFVDEPDNLPHPPIVVVVDDKVDETLSALNHVIVASEWLVVQPVQERTLRSASSIIGQSTSLTHGTQMACILASAAPKARIVTLDVANNVGWIDDAMVAFALDRVLSKWAVDYPGRLTAVSISLGDEGWSTGTACDQSTQMAITFSTLIHALEAIDVPVVLPSGNGSSTNEVYFPACIQAAVTVGGTRQLSPPSSALMRMGSSNWCDLLDVGARGTMVGVVIDPLVQSFDISDGTSVSVPFVAGALTVLRSVYPQETLPTFLTALESTGAQVSDGGGVREIRVHAAVQSLAPNPNPAPTPPLPPTHLPIPTSPSVFHG